MFAEAEKTEKPTPKRRREARKEGQVFQSREVTTAFILLAAFLGKAIWKIYNKILMDIITEMYSSIEN